MGHPDRCEWRGGGHNTQCLLLKGHVQRGKEHAFPDARTAHGIDGPLIYDPIADAFVSVNPEGTLMSDETDYTTLELGDLCERIARQEGRVNGCRRQIDEYHVEIERVTQRLTEIESEGNAARAELRRRFTPAYAEGGAFVAADTAADDEAPAHGYLRPVVGVLDTTDEASVEVTISAGSLRGIVGALIDHYGEQPVKDALDIVTAF